jgi:hypothetical protein
VSRILVPSGIAAPFEGDVIVTLNGTETLLACVVAENPADCADALPAASYAATVKLYVVDALKPVT